MGYAHMAVARQVPPMTGAVALTMPTLVTMAVPRVSQLLKALCQGGGREAPARILALPLEEAPLRRCLRGRIVGGQEGSESSVQEARPGSRNARQLTLCHSAMEWEIMHTCRQGSQGTRTLPPQPMAFWPTVWPYSHVLGFSHLVSHP
jgi:hypothetical protein